MDIGTPAVLIVCMEVMVLKKQYLALLITAILAVTSWIAGCYLPAEREIQKPQRLSAAELILDAGHGGEDGGAVSPTGAAESHINLKIVLDMEDILGLYGVCPLLLRREDVSLHGEEAETLREKKVSDLKHRVAVIEGEPQADLISIHQNSYPDSGQYGLQVFYAPTEGSQEMGEWIQQTVTEALRPGKQRSARQIPETVYLMNHISCRAVLVECGFLTNPEEEQLLISGWYQKKLALLISGAWLEAKRTI